MQTPITIFSSTDSADESTHQLHFGPRGYDPESCVLDMEHIFLGHILELHYVSLVDGVAEGDSDILGSAEGEEGNS